MLFPAFFRPVTSGGYSVDFPDFPGCISAGDDLEDAARMAHEALQFHVDGMVHDGDALPSATPQRAIDKFGDDAAHLMFIRVALAVKRQAHMRLNVTLPERVVAGIDALANELGESRSGVLAVAAREYCKKHG